MNKIKKSDLGFSFKIKSEDEILILRGGKKVTTLRAEKVEEFLNKIESRTFGEQQQIIARITGNYKRGNERQAKNHLRNK